MPPRGFTLIELIVVLAIMALMLVIAAPYASNALPGVTLTSAAHVAAAGLRTARSLAISRNREVAFTLDVAAHRFTVDDGRATRSLDEALDITLETARSELGDETVGTIRFFSDGSSTGGRVTLALDERDYHVDVDWLTGRVSIRD